MESDSRRKRSPSEDSDDGHRRRSRKYDRSPSPRRSRYRRSRSRDRRSRSSSRDRRREKSSRSQDWNKVSSATSASSATAANPAGYVPPQVPYQAPPPPNTSQPPPQLGTYASGYSNYNYNYGQGYEYSYQQPPGYRSDYPPPNWPGNQVPYNNQQAPPPPTLSSNQEQSRNVEPVPPGMVPPSLPRPEDAKKEAIAAEVKQQKATLAKQREEYVKKSATLQRELEILRQQCDEIGKEGGCENNRIIKENQKLQVEIQNKMKSINNVIDMLNGIIGDKVTIDDLKNKFKPENRNKRSKSPKEEFSSEKIETPEKVAPSETDRDNKSSKDDKPIYNFVHYDPEMHWCKVCDIFPKTAKEYLNHLHSNNHKETCLERKIVDMPWHEHVGEGSEKEVPYYPGLPTKRTPIKGLQFFSPATAWYCKLCDAWIGDLHCASLHLKSKRHSENFSRFVEQNPHWETDWMADREKAFSDEKHKQIQLEIQKHKEDEQQQPVPVQKPKKAKKNKKKSKKSKKRKQKSSNSDSSSDSDNTDSDSDQDTSKSIRVAMRNKMKASTQAILNEEIDYHGIKLKGPWAQVAQQQIQNVVNSELHAPEPDDRQLLNSIRDKLKAKQEEEIKSMNNRKQVMEKTIQESEHEPQFQKKEDEMAAWAQKDPSKPFWLKKEEEKLNVPNKPEIPEPKEIPKPHMGFWTKQQVNMPPKPIENKPIEKEDDRDRDRDRERDRDRDRYKDDRDRKYDRRDDKYERYDKYDRRRGRDRDRDRDRDYYDDRRKRDRDSGDSPRRNWRESPKRGYDKYKERREDSEPNDDSKFDKKMNDPKLKKNSAPPKKPPTPITKGKLPFIGRLPLFKKKVEEPKLPEKEPLPLPYTQSKFENTPKVPCEIINPPGIVHITKLATPLNLNNSSMKPQMKILVAPPPPVLKESKPTQQVVDMEIEDQSEEVVIEQPIIDHQKETAKIPVPTTLPPMNQPPPNFVSQQQDNKPFINRPPPMFNNPPPPVNFTQNPPPRFQVPRPNFVQNHQTQIPPPNVVGYPNPPPAVGEVMVPDVSEIPEPTDKRPENSHPLPEDLQEALNIIFPKDEVPETKGNSQDNSIMYASMYSMLGCVGYGPEFMDHPPPEITQPEQDSEAQPGPDDLRMLGIDEGDCVL